jgi:hypothetical protein
MNIDSCIFSYEITKGMKSFGPKGLLKSKKSRELINCQIQTLSSIVNKTYVVVGFGSEKLTKKISLNPSVSIIKNDNFKTSNEGYALRLLLSNIGQSDGILIISNGLLIDLSKVNLDKSKIFFTHKNIKQDFNLGCVFETSSSQLENIFYNINDDVWCECIFLSSREIEIIKQYIKTIDIQNMFLFEIINNSIKHGAQYFGEFISPNKIVKIQSIKDSNKIKDLA